MLVEVGAVHSGFVVMLRPFRFDDEVGAQLEGVECGLIFCHKIIHTGNAV